MASWICHSECLQMKAWGVPGEVCQTRVAWIGAPGHGWEMLQHLCQPPGTVAEALLPDACHWCQQ